MQHSSKLSVTMAMAAFHSFIVCLAISLPFPFYWFLWNFPHTWVRFCEPSADPCHRMAQVSHLLKLAQIAALLSVSSLSWPPLHCLLLILLGQFLNFRVYQLLGEDGVYYGVRFGKDIPWVHKFPFGYMQDPQYIGSALTLLGCLCWVPWQYALLWCAGYVFLGLVERGEDPSSRVKPIKR